MESTETHILTAVYYKSCETAKVKIKKPTDEVETNPTSVGFLFLEIPIQFCLTREGMELLVWVLPTSPWAHHCGVHLIQ